MKNDIREGSDGPGNSTSSTFTIFTDGSSRGNPGPGGWGAVLVRIRGDEGIVKELGGGESHTTNNRMEVFAAIGGLENVPEGGRAIVYTDSSYLINGITKWLSAWKRNGWKTKAKTEVLNSDLWSRLDQLVMARHVTWEYVGGHIGVLGNERCDVIATGFADGNNPELYSGPLASYPIPKILDVSHDAIKKEIKEKNGRGSKSRSKAKAYSYVSKVGGKIKIHSTWADCEKRVKGVKGARYKKALTKTEEDEILHEFS